VAQSKPKTKRIPLLPLRGLLVFPGNVLHLDVGREKSVRALEKATADDHTVLLCAQTEMAVEDPSPDDIYRVGTVARVRQMLRLPNGTIRVLVEGLVRAEVVEYHDNPLYLDVSVRELSSQETMGSETSALMRSVVSQFEQYIQLSRKLSPDALAAVSDIDEPGRLADAVATHLPLRLKDKQELLETLDVVARLEKLLLLLNNEREVLELERRINQRVKKQIEKTQKEYYLREQMKAIQKELGEKEGRSGEADELREQLAKADHIPPHVREKIEKEIDRLEKMPPTTAEGTVVRNYIDWLLALPWDRRTEDDLDLARAAAVLDEDHYGLEKPKERVLEYLAVRKLSRRLRGPILCFIGPPGVGKTSIARSIARSLGRKFVRISLGGVRDEAEIRGHRRTYVGALPGRIIQALKTAGTNNPVLLLDEVDKMSSDFRGDPASALLEVLDPEQNHAFSDHYIEIPVDLSNVMFITTANASHNIPRPLLDRMEVIPISGYTELEKLEIAKRHLLPKQRGEHGLTEEQLDVTDDAFLRIIRAYTRESGVRQLERQIAALCRKTAKRVVERPDERVRIDADDVAEYLGPEKYRYGVAEETDQTGVATGLAWTEAGGDMLNVEVAVVPGKGKLTLTGQLGDVMKESAQAALSYIRSRVAEFGIAVDFYEKSDIHIHVPEGAIPKDGPSAGITMATALVSALADVPVSRDVAMTGEITLRGRVLPVGGVKEKVLAAHRAGVRKVILPKDNEKDLRDVPEKIRSELEFVLVSHMDEVLRHALVRLPSRAESESAPDPDGAKKAPPVANAEELVVPPAPPDDADEHPKRWHAPARRSP